MQVRDVARSESLTPTAPTTKGSVIPTHWRPRQPRLPAKQDTDRIFQSHHDSSWSHRGHCRLADNAPVKLTRNFCASPIVLIHKEAPAANGAGVKEQLWRLIPLVQDGGRIRSGGRKESPGAVMLHRNSEKPYTDTSVQVRTCLIAELVPRRGARRGGVPGTTAVEAEE